MKKAILIAGIIALAMSSSAQTKHKNHKQRFYKISYADTVNIYDHRTVIAIKQLNGGVKYIVVRDKDRYLLKNANVVNIYGGYQSANIDTLTIHQ